MLELKNVSKYYNSNGVVTLGLRNINLKLSLGEIVAITGDSGSGKSTLLNVMTGVDTYEDGEILFFGNETSYFDSNDMDLFRKNNVSFIYQKYNIIDSYTVLENVMIPLLIKGLAKEEAKAEALEIIKRVGLDGRVDHKGSKLSGGEKQRCVIARALASDSKILACDEPTGNLDSKTGDEIIKLIKEVSKDRLVLIVTHNYDQVKDIVTRRLRMSDGELIEDVSLTKEARPDENEVMSLEAKPISKRVLSSFSALNIKNTPKKSALVGLVFLVVSFIALLMSMLTLNMASYGSSYNRYNIIADDRILVYNKDHEALDINKLSGFDYYLNPFYEDDQFAIRVNPGSELMPNMLALTLKRPDGKLKYGTEPTKAGDSLLVVPLDYYWLEECKGAIGSEVFYDAPDTRGANISLAKRITGILISDEVNSLTLYSKDSLDEKFIKAYLLNNLEVINNSNGQRDSINIAYNPNIEDTTLYLPYSYENSSYDIIFKNTYRATIKSDVKIAGGEYPMPTLVVKGYDIVPDIEMDAYEASIYTDDTNKAIAELNKLGFMTTLPSKAAGRSSLDMAIINLFIGITFLALVSLFFVSYAIISRIYTSKSKDYGILRALGVVRGDLGFMVKLETISLCSISSVISLAVAIILKYALPRTIFSFLSLLVIPIYIVVMILFSYLLARRFNHHLFRFSLNTTLKDGDR